jgi:hypothetical protein
MTKKNLYESLIKALIVLVPTYITAYITNKMIYVIPMLAAVSFIAASIFEQKDKRRLDEDGHKKEDLGARKDEDG